MSEELRIGATEPAPGSPAFAVSRDSAGILIGVRDNAAPQFAVSRDADGLLLSAWPSRAPSIPPSVRSYATSINDNTDPRLVSRPDGLEIGDLMVLASPCFNAAYEDRSGPSGFTKILATAGTLFTATVWTKVADSADVAASSFSVGNVNLANLGLVLYAVRDAGLVEYSAITRRTAGAWPSGFTPAAGGALLLAFLSSGSLGLLAVARTALNIETWTNDFRDFSWGAYYSSHASYGVGATGNITSPLLGINDSGTFAIVAVGSA